MGRVLILIVLVAIVAWMVLSRTRGPKAPRQPRQPRAPEPAPMLACAHCGVHLPQSEALTDAAGHAYCSPAHRLAGPDR